MVWDRNLLPASDETKAANLPRDNSEKLAQCWIGQESGLRVVVGNYQRSSKAGQIKSINRHEISEILEAMAEYLTM